VGKKIVFINQATGYLTIDIINAFVESEQFDKVALIAGSVRVQNKELDKKVGWSKIVKYNRGSSGKKALSWLIGTLQIALLLLTRYRKYEAFYVSIPPTAYLLSSFLKNPFSVLVYDIYPDALNTYKISERSLLYRLWVSWNKTILPKAHRVFTLSTGMAAVLGKYLPEEKVVVIPNWSDVSLFKPVAKNQNPFVMEHQLADKFVVQYSGNIGYTHNVEVLVELAKELQDQDDILFQIIGRGERTAAIKALVERYSLKNVVLLPFQPDEILPFSLAAADLAVITLNDETAMVSVPSKTYNLLAVGTPLLCVASSRSELNRLVSACSNGKCYEAHKKEEMANFILELKNAPEMLKSYKTNSRKASSNFTSKNAHRYLQSYVQGFV
jgi:glycosyltransferase involved in cell wall biosynthesis